MGVPFSISVFIFLIIVLNIDNKSFVMENCHKVMTTEELLNLLDQEGIDQYESGEQLDYRYALFYHLSDGKLVVLPGGEDYSDAKGLLINNQKCFDEMLKDDYLPIDNPEKDLYEYDQERIRAINLNIDYYRNYLNDKFNLSFENLNEESVFVYYDSIQKQYSKGEHLPIDLIALVAVIGEYIRFENDGKWIIFKNWGEFNPFFVPKILTGENKVIDLDTKVLKPFTHGTVKEDFIITFRASFKVDPGYQLPPYIKSTAEYIIF